MSDELKHAAMAGVLLGVLAVAVAGCGGKSASKSSGGGGGQTVVAGVNANNHGTKSVSSNAEIELDDYYFKPTVLEGRPGSTVTLELKNEGTVEHNFTVSSQNIDKNIQPGGSVKVAVTIPKSGAVSFVCKFHESMGMAGALEPNGGGGMTGTAGGTTRTSKGYGY